MVVFFYQLHKHLVSHLLEAKLVALQTMNSLNAEERALPRLRALTRGWCSLALEQGLEALISVKKCGNSKAISVVKPLHCPICRNAKRTCPKTWASTGSFWDPERATKRLCWKRSSLDIPGPAKPQWICDMIGLLKFFSTLTMTCLYLLRSFFLRLSLR